MRGCKARKSAVDDVGKSDRLLGPLAIKFHRSQEPTALDFGATGVPGFPPPTNYLLTI